MEERIMYYAKREIIGGVDRRKKPLPDCVVVSAFPSKANRDQYVERTLAVPLKASDPLVVRAKQMGLRDDYHSVKISLKKAEELMDAGDDTEEEAESEEEPDIEPDPEIVEPVKPKKTVKYKKRKKSP